MAQDQTELQSYYDRCRAADWYYQYSDDGGRYRRGKAEIGGLQAEAAASPQKYAIFHGMKAWVFSSLLRTDAPPSLEDLLHQVSPA